MSIESGIHPCADSINCAYLAFQGHCRRVTHSFQNVSPWTSLFLALSGDISLNPGPASRYLYGCLLNIRSIRNKSAWRHENSTSNRSRYRAPINHYNFLLEKSKCNHYSNIVAEKQGNPKTLWNCFKKILHRPSVAVLPDCTNKTDLANTFCKFFYDKILKIRYHTAVINTIFSH